MKFFLDNTEDIFLYQLLKASGTFEEYAHIRRVTQEGMIKVNGQTVFKQRTRIFPGDEVTYKDIHIKIIAGRTIDNKTPQKLPPKEEHIHHGRQKKWKTKPLKKDKDLQIDLEKQVHRLHNHLRFRKISLALAESCTGGMASEFITSLSGASTYFIGSIISYSNRVKMKILQVDEAILKEKGAVSEETASAMAVGVEQTLGSELSGSITGIAGPEGGEDNKPVGTVYIGVKYQSKLVVKRYNFSGSRQEIRRRSCLELYKMLIQITQASEN